jgi:type II secretion system protein D
MIKNIFAFALSVAAVAVLCSEALAQIRTPGSIGQRRTRGPLMRQMAANPVESDAEGVNAETAADGRAFDGADVAMVFKVYSEMVGKTILVDPATPKATITLKNESGQKLTDAEWLEAIEVVLEMNGIHLEPYGEKFLRALPRKDVRKEGIPLIMDTETKLAESGRVVSMMIPFKNISTEEAQKALEGFKSNSGILLVFERTNSILVTDTQQNINRMLEIAKSIDVASPVLENVFVRQIKNAAANDIKTALETIVQESQKEQEQNGKKINHQTAQQQPRTLLGSRLLGRNQPAAQPAAVNNASLVMSVSDADRGMIRGKVLILADERSNKLIIVTQKSNMDFFDKVIEQLDVETTPDTVVKVYRLKYAEAEEVSDMINDLIGNAASSKNSGKQNQNQAAKSGSSGNLTRNRQTAPAAKKPANQRSGEAKAGELSKDNTTVLADKRINGLVVMTNKELLPVVESIIESMDVKLSQVLIETVIIEISLGDTLKTGVDWVMGGKVAESVFMNHGQMIGGGAGTTQIGNFVGAATNAVTPIGKGMQYLVKSDKLNLAAVVQASKTDSRTKYVASPIVMTVDNKEATIEATSSRQFLTGWSAVSSSYAGSGLPSPNYTAKDIGITLKIEPKINPNGTVMLNVEEEYSQVSGKQDMLTPKGS